jgi:hypothetical protein
MYYLLKSELISWNGKYIRAIPELRIPCDETIWYTEPSLKLETFRFRFLVDGKASFPDNYLVDSVIQLFSNQLINILHEYNLDFESYPAILIDQKSKKIIQKEYRVFRLIRVTDCLDLSRTEIQDFPIKKKIVKLLGQPEYQKKFLDSGILMTRIAGFESQIIIHQELKTIFERKHVTGFRFSIRNLDSTAAFGKNLKFGS